MIDTFKTKSGKEVKITFIKHGSLMFELDGIVVQVDPVSQYADYNKFPKADAILITHEHHDHLDKVAIEDARKKGTRIILNQSGKEQLGEGEPMKNGEVKRVLNFEVEAVPAYNITKERTQFHPKGRDNGYVISFDSFRIYVAGDTEDVPEMANLKDICVAFLPVNQPYTMTIEQAIRAVRLIKPKIFYPYHYGEVETETKINDLKNMLNDFDVRIREMQ